MTRLHDLPRHFQFYKDLNNDLFQDLADDMHFTDCQADKMPATIIHLLSFLSPVRAATIGGFMLCHKSVSSGPHGYFSKCDRKMAGITGAEIVGGVEPIWQTNLKNFTIALDGLTLQPFPPCLRQNCVAAFSGTPYQSPTVSTFSY